jgi:diguanylate cyclase (GGDEF)-like protein/PAS domain S-box-containing protein
MSIGSRLGAVTRFKHRSIRVKLYLLTIVNSGLALLLAGISLFAYEGFQQRAMAARQVSTQAGIVAESSTAALTFDDERDAIGILAALRGDSRIVEAAIYDRNNQLFATYRHTGRAASNHHGPHPRHDGFYFENGAVLVFEPVSFKHERIGTVFLEASMDEVYGRLWRYTGSICLILLVSMGLALLTTTRMRRTITDPIGELSGVARRVSVEKDYSVRALSHANDEIGLLIDSFNEMLSQIELRARAREKTEELLRESEERYALAARGANDGLWDWKLTTNELYFSPRWGQMLGYSDNQLLTGPENWFSRIHPNDRPRVMSEMAAHRQGRTPEFVSEYRMRHRNGGFIWTLTRGIAVRGADGMAIRMAGSQTDITEGKIADPLTGLPNRLYFLDRLESAIETAHDGGTLFAVLFLDLDRFKLVNDSLGHAAGDELLVEVASRLRSCVRTPDPLAIVSGPCVVARFAGDEFAILLNGIRQESDAVVVADRILQHLGAPFQVGDRQMFATVSIGIALSSDAATPEDLLRNADTAMYHAKTRGRARADVFDDQMRERALERLEIEIELRKAIEEGQLVLFYQPQVLLGENRITGYEALVRWQHPERGLILPNDFIPIAEETDLIVPLGKWVLQQACRQMADWQRQFVPVPPISVSVNVSFKQLIGAELVDDVARILDETGLSPELLKLEMTESTLMANASETGDKLRQLKKLGVGLEIDDFGTGYSSLSRLKRLPFDTVKIDRSFIKDMGTAREGKEIVKTILNLARTMGMDVVAEGVETHEQCEALARLGCSHVQGYFFSRPLQAEAAEALMREQATMRRAFGVLQKGGVNPPDQQPYLRWGENPTDPRAEYGATDLGAWL